MSRLGQWGQGHPGQSALAEVALLFLPALPAYLWLWPNVEGMAQLVAQLAAYGYLLVGALVIGLRRWTLDQLGVSGRGWRLSLVCGLCVIVGRALVALSVDWPLWQHPLTPAGLLGDVLFYVGAVGVTEELLFRGLIYRALEDWRGRRRAIWGSALGFGLYHVGGQGPLGLIAGLLMGVIFGAIRWRAGGIAGLIVVHGLTDVTSLIMLPTLNPQDFGRPDIASPTLLVLGYALILAVPVYLWKFHPHVEPLLARGRKP